MLLVENLFTKSHSRLPGSLSNVSIDLILCSTCYDFSKRSINHLGGVERLFILEVHGNAFIINMYQEGNEVRVWAMTEILARRRYIPQVELAVLNDKKVAFKNVIFILVYAYSNFKIRLNHSFGKEQ